MRNGPTESFIGVVIGRYNAQTTLNISTFDKVRKRLVGSAEFGCPGLRTLSTLLDCTV
jgi:hypothetical protein